MAVRRTSSAFLAILLVAAVPAAAQAGRTPPPLRTPAPLAPPAPTRTGGPVGRAVDQGRLAEMVARHQRVKARLTFEEQSVLDHLTASVKRQLFARPLPRNLLGATATIVSGSIPGLLPQEAASLAEYVLGGIAAGGAMGAGNTSGAIAGAGGDSSQALLAATQSMQETQMSFNLQYLQLQSQMQEENRSYTAVSNIMKTKHDTVKNSIGNIR